MLKALPFGWMDELRIDVQHAGVGEGPVKVLLGLCPERLSAGYPVGNAASDPGW
jgi:hypothetical protein